jgi:hypothetical protein
MLLQPWHNLSEMSVEDMVTRGGSSCLRHSKNREKVLKKTPSSHNMEAIRKLNTRSSVALVSLLRKSLTLFLPVGILFVGARIFFDLFVFDVPNLGGHLCHKVPIVGDQYAGTSVLLQGLRQDVD